MKQFHKLLIFTLTFIPLFIACGSTKESTNSELDEVSIAKAERIILELVNKHRKKNDLPKLKAIDELTEIAEKHSKNMGDGKVKVGHGGFDNRYNKIKKKLKMLEVLQKMLLLEIPV